MNGIQLLGAGSFGVEQLLGMPDDVAAAVLSGSDQALHEEIISGIGKMPAGNAKTAASRKYKKAIASGNVTGKAASAQPNSRIELLNRLSFFPPEYRTALANGRMRIADMYYFVTKNLVAGTVRMFETSDSVAPGVGNVDKAKIENDKPFLASGLQLLSGAGNVAGVGGISFGIADRGVINGLVTLRHDGKEILKRCGGEIFDTTNRQDRAIGMVMFDNPMIIMPGIIIELEVEVAAAPLQASVIKAGLIGSGFVSN